MPSRYRLRHPWSWEPSPAAGGGIGSLAPDGVNSCRRPASREPPGAGRRVGLLEIPLVTGLAAVCGGLVGHSGWYQHPAAWHRVA